MTNRARLPARLRLSPCAAALGAALLAVSWPATTAAADTGVRMRTRLNDTGLVRCTRDFATYTTDCAGTGQDAETGRDVTHPARGDGRNGFSFQKVCNSGQVAGTGTCTNEAVLGPGPDDWGCTADRVTGLVWEVKTADDGLRDGRKTYTNLGGGDSGDTSGFVTAVNAAGLCGASDWRLPTTYELQNIDDFNARGAAPAIDVDWFPNTAARSYWTGDAYFAQPTVAWLVQARMHSNNTNVVGLGRSAPLAVRLVRDPAPPQDELQRFVASAGGQEVTDRITKLVWRRCVEGMHFDGSTCTGNFLNLTLPDALGHANAVAQASGQPWRLPNAKELHSITDEAVNTPAIDATVFPGTPAAKQWTSTVISWHSPTGGWVVDFNDARVLAYYQGFAFPSRLVRTAD
jgi:hypothetical protein